MKATICTKCGCRWALQEEGIYPLCYICFLKTKRFYSFAIKIIKNTDWWNFKTGIKDRKIGWSFAENGLFTLLLASILNCASLNKTPKVPELLKVNGRKHQLQILGISEWRANTTVKYYNLEE